jgi:hypothetical protein
MHVYEVTYHILIYILIFFIFYDFLNNIKNEYIYFLKG